jgi:hypothetical protein
MKNTLIGFLWGIALCALLTWLFPHGRQTDTVTVTDTLRDTVISYRPTAKDSTVVRYITQRLSVVRDTVVAHDTVVVCRDSASVVIPIVQKTYRDSLYTAWISGYRASLDSIAIRRTEVIRSVNSTPKRWGVGVQAGYGTGGFHLGVGISYNILIF